MSSTPTLAAREPDGWWTGHKRYRNYVLFAATGIVLTVVNILILAGVAAADSGAAAWGRFLGALGSPIGLPVSAFLLFATLFFAIRYLRVGAKIPAVRLGPVPAPNMTLVLVLQFAGFATITLAVIAALSGLIV